MKKIILSLSILTLSAFAQNSAPVTEVPVSDTSGAPVAAPVAVEKDSAQAKTPERAPASTKKKHHAKKVAKKKHKKKKAK